MSNLSNGPRVLLRACAMASAALVAISLSACTGPSSDDPSSGAPSSEDTINARIFSDPSSFNPALAAGLHTFQLDRQLFDTVLRRDENGLVGGLASQWTANSASDYTFTIRDDATCSDGTPITASVVADSLTYLADPNTGSTWAPLVFGQTTPVITADDSASTVRIELSAPFANLQEGLTVAQTGIICPAGLADLDGLGAGSVKGAYSGPYELTDSQAGLSYTLTFRDDYTAWPDFESPLTGEPAKFIEYTLGNDESTTGNQMLAGQIDFANFADWNTIARFADNDTFHQSEITGYTTYVIFNEREGRIFADPALRKAAAQSISQEAFNTVFSQGNAELLTSIVPSTYECVLTDPSLLTEQDVDSAKKVLTGVSGIKMLGNTANVSFSNGADYLFSALTEAGASVDLNKVDNATFWSTIANGSSDWDVTFIGDSNAAQTISASLDRTMGPSVEENGRNFSGSENVEGEAALENGLTTTDSDERCAAFEDAQKSLFERNDVVPLAGGTTVTISSEHVTARKIGEDVDAATLRLE